MSRKIGALWVRETKEGMKYMSGTLEDLHGSIPIAVFKNDKKDKETQPDYHIVLSEKKKDSVDQVKDMFGEDDGSEKPADSSEIKLDDIPLE